MPVDPTVLFTITNDAHDVPEGVGDDLMYIALRRQPLPVPVEEFAVWGVLSIALGQARAVTVADRCIDPSIGETTSVVRLYHQGDVADGEAVSEEISERRPASLLTAFDTGRTIASVCVAAAMFQDSTQYVPPVAAGAVGRPLPPPPPSGDHWFAAIVRPGSYERAQCHLQTSEIYGDWQIIRLGQHWSIHGSRWSSYNWQQVFF